jgi:CRP-like cAMP-binding protein
MKRVFPFNNLCTADLLQLLELSETQTYTYPPDNIVIHIGDDCSDMWLILRGKVKVYLKGHDSREIILGTLKEGDYFGEITLFNGHGRSANVATVTECEFIKIKKSHIEELIQSNSEVAFKFIYALCDKLILANEHIARLAFDSSLQKIVKALLDIADIDSNAKVAYTIIDRPTAQHLADLAGIARETVQKSLKDLSEIGVIRLSKGKIELFLRDIGNII